MGLLAAVFILGGASAAQALVVGDGPAEPIDCRAAAAIVEREAGLPTGMLLAIGKIESGRFDPRTGRTEPWPWSTDLAGEDHVFQSLSDAVAWTGAQLAAGRRSIDVGCFQINLFYHPDAFSSLEEAFDPLANGRYAARFLNALYQRVGSWRLAVADYHSADPALGLPYGDKVLAAWGTPGLAVEPVAFSVPRPAPGLPAAPRVSLIDRVVVRSSFRALAIRVVYPDPVGAVDPRGMPGGGRGARGLPRVIRPG